MTEPLAKNLPLIPHDTVSGRALTVVIAILTFLACLCAGGVVLLAASSSAWRDEVSREVTVQILPGASADAEAEAAKVVAIAAGSSAVASVKPLSRADTERTLAPWLGTGLDLSQLPIPHLVVATLATNDPSEVAALRAAIEKAAPTAVFDDNTMWLSHFSAVGRSLTLFAVLLLLLVVAAIAVAVGFATRAAMAGAREIVDVLHFVGASDGFITRRFQGHFFRLSALGTAAGGAAAVALFVLTEVLAGSASSNGATVLFGAFHFPLIGYGAILAVCVALVAMAGVFSRAVAAAHLRALG